MLLFFNQLKLRKQHLGTQGAFSSGTRPLVLTFPEEIIFLSLAQSPLGFSRSLQGILDKADNATSRSSTANQAQGVPTRVLSFLPQALTCSFQARSCQAPGTLHHSRTALGGARGSLRGATTPTPTQATLPYW